MDELLCSDNLVHNENVSLLLLVSCQPLDHPDNGVNNCSSGGNVYFSGETCVVTCNDEYLLMGSNTRTCVNDGSWSGSNAICILISK